MNLRHPTGPCPPAMKKTKGSQRPPATTTIRLGRPRGFTLTELLVTLAIIAIFASFAIPSFRGLVANTSVSSAVNAFVSDTRYARGEAMRRGKSVTICRSAHSPASAPKCAAGSGLAAGNWMEGWVVFVDEDGDGALDAASDVVVRVQEPLTGIGSFLALHNAGQPRASNYITYNAVGRAVGIMGRWLVQAPGASSAANTAATRTLCMNQVGRVKAHTGGILCPV